jgi:NTE family protein
MRLPLIDARRPTETLPETAKPSSTPFESIALLLQGGGALGSYQAGVYEALLERGVEPTWIAGISIGAINSAIIAGNATGDRLAKLRAFWEMVSDAGDNGWSDHWTGLWQGDKARGWINQFAASRAMIGGVPGFFTPRMPPPYLLPVGAGGVTSYYDVTSLRSTIERLVDFDRINAKPMRFSVGAVNVRTGNFIYFDNETDTIRPEHIMASCALPPAFDAIEVDGEFYWDGGMVSNTPLDWVLSERSDLDTLVLQVDLWSARGTLPRDLAEVAVRMKEVQFSSRTRAASDEFYKIKRLKAAFHELLTQMPVELTATPQAQLLAKACEPAVFNIVQLIYRSTAYEGQSKDYEFSRRTMEDHWRAGYVDATTTLASPEIFTLPTTAQGVAVYDYLTSVAKNGPH